MAIRGYNDALREMIFNDAEPLIQRIAEVSGRPPALPPMIFEDTSNVFGISSGHVLRLGGNDYFIKGEAHEGRFGLDDEPKHWVKYAWDLTSGSPKIIKLEIDEEFSTRIGLLLIKATRSAEKEARFIDLVRGRKNFMQGFSVRDAAGNLVRIIDEIKGESLFNRVLAMGLRHEEYYAERYPWILKNLIECIEALHCVFQEGLHHGDIRNDHVFIESPSSVFKWIDFDYSVPHADYDLWSLGNLVVFTAAGGLLLFKDVLNNNKKYPLMRGEITNDDCSLYHRYRIANVRKVYPYVSKKINAICMRYAVGTFDMYERYEDFIDELHEAEQDFPSSSTGSPC